ncbi:hypothetical protein [Trichococcus pasteurii]|uniref:Uncharacterized protein n=1 Tax=Trichococcus pasteurii TaxID=43064 RepID=A0A1W1IE71_9LACT|nr:hypothetical protein [Trichococcus pasteurii]SFE10344.1 hypothetical protein SAMN04488086_101194 [Trichococcus pasteurii]SLM51327.1 Hypothetical protein TPAS_1003 [Trichococcus pasteurii]SSB92208.1 Hypothetical protein TPAS_1003 [Trichococcus pasteurii]
MSDQKIYLLLTDTGSMLTRTIKLFTRKKYNHVSLAFDAALADTFSFGRKKANNPFIGGFIHEDVTSDFYSQAKCAVYALTVSEEQASVMRGYVSSFEKEKEKYHYNLLGLLPALFNKEWDRENYYFCSHFVSTVLVEGDVLQAEKPVTLMRPTDILEALPFVPLYEGKLFHFNELSMSGVEQGLAYESERVIESIIDPDSADLCFPENFSPVPVL